MTLITNEIIDSRLKSSTPEIIYKLNIEKAYDHVNWSSYLEVMEKMGFRQKWVGWMKWCMSSASFSVLVNETPLISFKALGI